MHETDLAYSIRSTWWLYRLDTEVPFIACDITQLVFLFTTWICRIFSQNMDCRIFSFI